MAGPEVGSEEGDWGPGGRLSRADRGPGWTAHHGRVPRTDRLRCGRDAHLVTRLREAGALFLAKANLTELANFLTEGMPSGYSSVGAQTLQIVSEYLVDDLSRAPSPPHAPGCAHSRASSDVRPLKGDERLPQSPAPPPGPSGLVEGEQGSEGSTTLPGEEAPGNK